MPHKEGIPKDEGRIRVSLLAVPDAMFSTLSGLYDVFNLFSFLGTIDHAVPTSAPFQAEIVALDRTPTMTASGLPLTAHRSINDIEHTNIVILPSMLAKGSEWIPGRYPEVVEWLSAMHAGGALLCSACSGVLLLAETGLLDGWEATIHWAYAPTFRRNFPKVKLRIEEVLIATGRRKEIVMSGASASWHDLVLYLVARHVGPTAAQAIRKFMLLQWHVDGQAPYIAFAPPVDHGDASVLKLQQWLKGNLTVANPVEEMVKLSELPERTFKRRFRKATGYSPIAYVQNLRIEEAKRRLERTNQPIDEISWAVGYEDPAFFRRLFRRVTRLSPRDYRKMFRLPKLPGMGSTVS